MTWQYDGALVLKRASNLAGPVEALPEAVADKALAKLSQAWFEKYTTKPLYGSIQMGIFLLLELLFDVIMGQTLSLA